MLKRKLQQFEQHKAKNTVVDQSNDNDEQAVTPTNKTKPNKQLKPSKKAKNDTNTTSDINTALPDKYTNKQRCLVVCSRGISQRERHLMRDLLDLMPHSKKDVKVDAKNNATVLNEIIELNNCTSCMYLENRKHSDLYMWLSRLNGPSVKFLVQNIHTMSELKLTGNAIKGSRPLLVFDAQFDTTLHYKIIKQLLQSTYQTPYMHPKSRPFIDRVCCFYICDNKIWFRNYQIQYNIHTDSTITTQQQINKSITEASSTKPILIEIGPRFVLTPIRIFSNSFYGQTLWLNPIYESPNAIRSRVKREFAARYDNKIDMKIRGMEHQLENKIEANELDNVFITGEDAFNASNDTEINNATVINTSEQGDDSDESDGDNVEDVSSESSDNQ